MENNTNENIKLCLSKFNYTYLEQGNNIRVTHFKPLFIDICINENIIQMTPKLIGWNILTGINDMNFEKVSSYLKRMAILHVFFIIALYIYIQYRDINIDNNINKPLETDSLRVLTRRYNPDELLNSVYADDWQVVLQPQQFDSGAGSLATDIMACSVAVHALKQCSTRKTINHSYSAAQICQHLRSYLLSQIVFEPAQRHAHRQVRFFTGHIIGAAYPVGWDIPVSHDGQCYFTISSRCGLLTRYANMQDYDINGWSS